MALHYDLDILPARPRRPKDKAKVEAGVRFAQTYILGRMRNRTFFSLEEANVAIVEAMALMNTRPMRRLGVSRQGLFESVEKPALRALPATEYEYAEWRLARVNLDYQRSPQPLLRKQRCLRSNGCGDRQVVSEISQVWSHKGLGTGETSCRLKCNQDLQFRRVSAGQHWARIDTVVDLVRALVCVK